MERYKARWVARAFDQQPRIDYAETDTSLFIYSHGSHTAYLLVYVDDILLTASSPEFLSSTISAMHRAFNMKDMGPLHYFLGISIERTASGMFLSQHKYASDIIARASMTNCNPCLTPVDTKSKLSASSGPPVADPHFYRSLAGALQYLTFTRPDICYSVQQICLFMHDPREPHFSLP